MLAGFGFSSLKLQFPAGTSIIVEIIYLAITASAVGLELCAILNSACCSVFGKPIPYLNFQALENSYVAREDFSQPSRQ